MTPAQRRKRIKSFKEKKSNNPLLFKKVFLSAALLLSVFLYVVVTGRQVWGNSKITVAVKGREQIRISTFDRDAQTITDILIPANTQTNVSRQLGTWKIGSVWQLGENERLEGTLLSETVLKNLTIPVNAWADGAFSVISDGKISALVKGLLPYKSSLGVGDKVQLALFSIGVPPAKRIEINLSESGFIRKTKLVSGEEGYVIVGDLPQSLYYLFSDTRMGTDMRVEIQNHAKNPATPDLAVSVLEVLGAKVSAITKEDSGDFLCEVSGKNKEIVKLVAGIFKCDEISETPGGNFDLTIKLGEEFARRY